MTKEFNDNSCINVEFIDEECNKTSNIRPGGADGSAGSGIYGGADGSEKVSPEAITWMREFPCGPIDAKAIKTLFFKGFQIMDGLCATVKNIACQFSLT